jgi:hypothetical protein
MRARRHRSFFSPDDGAVGSQRIPSVDPVARAEARISGHQGGVGVPAIDLQRPYHWRCEIGV